ncbi:MAG: 50S ribosomal protein L31 [Bacteroidetes bacterium OLB10]|nr:MAG: 50S ribosomal protein L31 [Bacteroidetes bacterium OLB10]MBX3106214.1 DUF4199 domain-containing protein [Bacteroidota bacterium]
MKPFLKYGLLGAALSIIWTLIGYIMGNEMQEKLKWLSTIIMIAISVFCFIAAIKEERLAGEGFISFGKAFGTAFKTGLIMAIIGAIFTYLYFAFINTSYMTFVLEKAQEEMSNRGMDEEQIEMAMKMQSKFITPPVMAGFAFVGGLIVNLIIALILGAAMKKENPAGEIK